MSFFRPLEAISASAAAAGLLALVAIAPGCGAGTTKGSGGAGTDGGASNDGAAGGDAPGGGDDSGHPVNDGGGTAEGGGSSPAAGLASKLGKPGRLLVGLGGTPTSAITSQGITPDFYEQYLVGAGANDWTTWNSPSGAYVGVVGMEADSVGALPMYTLYQMATNGDGNISDIDDATFMTLYWSNAVLLFEQLAAYGKPALVNFEPDFWGYTEQASGGGDPTKVTAKVTIAPDCSSLTNDAAGIAHCLLQIARKYAPKAYVGFSPSDWGASTTADVLAWMKALGAGGGDFVVMQTLDRDGGCFEAATEADCKRAGTGWYWAASDFTSHLTKAQTFSQGLGLPLVWWQTPLGVPSTTPGGTPNHYRDNRVQYFLTNPSQLVAAGGLGVVFGAGSGDCTGVTTDSGQFKMLSSAYFAKPAVLP